jgi:adenine specific DNA methylase Mod
VNLLYYGDNLDVLRRHIKDDSIDLVYLDPPFKSNQDYNILFAEKDGSRSASQFKAFEDTWEWNIESVRLFEELVESGGRVSDVMRAFKQFLSTNDMLAYLTMMAPRLVELRRVLKSNDLTGVFCTSGSEREFTLEGSWYADEEIQAGTDRDAVAAG